jgi:alanyl-tRNA synthetase
VPMLDTVLEANRGMYPELDAQRELVTRVAGAEERDFAARLRQGLDRVETVLRGRGRGDSFPGDVAFELHDTYGFPIDLTAEIAEDAGLDLDRDRFDALMHEQRERARAGAKKGGGGIPVETYRAAAAEVGTTEFLGYEQLVAEAELGAIVTPGGLLHTATEGDEVEVVLARTPFYAEGGGQVGDRGVLTTPTGRLAVLDTQQPVEGLTVHRARVVAGEVTQGQPLEAAVDADRRLATARSHSATHVLHAVMKEELGDHAQQAGSLNEPGRFRFDFPHFESVSRQRLAEIEQVINERVLADPYVQTEVMSLDDAKAAGAVANFGDKYGQVVRVVSIGDFSKELCGGTHVPRGAAIGTITIVREESIGSNTRRVEALTGLDAFRHLAHERVVAEEIARLVDVPVDQAADRVRTLLERVKQAEKELAKVRQGTLAQEAKRLADEAVREEGAAIVVTRADGVVGDDLRTLANQIRGHLATRGVVVVGTTTEDGKAQLVCALTSDLVDDGLEARPILHPAAQAVGGGAGGRGDLAQAGGRDGAALPQALEIAAAAARDAVRGAA